MPEAEPPAQKEGAPSVRRALDQPQPADEGGYQKDDDIDRRESGGGKDTEAGGQEPGPPFRNRDDPLAKP